MVSCMTSLLRLPNMTPAEWKRKTVRQQAEAGGAHARTQTQGQIAMPSPRQGRHSFHNACSINFVARESKGNQKCDRQRRRRSREGEDGGLSNESVSCNGGIQEQVPASGSRCLRRMGQPGRGRGCYDSSTLACKSAACVQTHQVLA